MPTVRGPMFIGLYCVVNRHTVRGKTEVRGIQPLPPFNFDTSLIIDKISPQTLSGLVKLAGFVQDFSNNLLNQLQDSNETCPSPPTLFDFQTVDRTFSQMLEYQSLQLMMLQFSAIKCCEVLLQDGSLLSYLAPTVKERTVLVDGGVVDPIAMMEVMKEVVKNLVAWAVKPSPMIDAVTFPDLERLHLCISHRTLFKIVQGIVLCVCVCVCVCYMSTVTELDGEELAAADDGGMS